MKSDHDEHEGGHAAAGHSGSGHDMLLPIIAIALAFVGLYEIRKIHEVMKK